MRKEKTVQTTSGWAVLPIAILEVLLIPLLVYLMTKSVDAAGEVTPTFWWLLLGLLFDVLLFGLTAAGFFIVEPNGSKVLLLFGKYIGTERDPGFHWANPFFSKRPVSLRVRTLNTETLKVNDHDGNPVEIAAVVVWQVVDTFEATFEVDDYVNFVTTQSETAVRATASSYPYDAEDDSVSLRRNTDEVSEELQKHLQDRLDRAGVRVLEARLSHLAYSPEIAGAMLRRQQAAAIIAARQRIVDGAVGMVEMALEHLEKSRSVQLDEERKAAMVSNLMVVLCSESATQPVINTGTLYT
ncbi:MAG: membrane protein [Fimbriimonadales bacterium]|nr:MAG: membrane protein [Fimbriimonadales bacterium]